MSVKLIQPLVKDLVEDLDSINNLKTNCITKIPQDIKLELNDDTLTLKAGSKVYDGAGNVINVTSDTTVKNTGNAQMYLCVQKTNKNLWAGYMTGGTVTERPSQPITYAVYYNTTTKVCEYWNRSVWVEVSLPIAIVTRGETGYTSIDQIFNGFGYIGNTPFRTNVSALLPNYRNSDGSLNNIVVNTTGVKTHEPITYDEFYYFHMLQNGDLAITLQKNYIISETEPPFVKSGCWYNPKTNIIWKSLSGSTSWTKSPSFHVVDCGTLKVKNGRITSFNPKLPIRIADDQDVVHKTGNEAISGHKTFNDGISANQIILDNIHNEIDLKNKDYPDFWGFLRLSGSGLTIGTKDSGSWLKTIIITRDEITCPTPPAGDNSGKIATTNWVKNEIKDYVVESGTNYRRYKSGFLMCWGQSGGAVIFPKPFSDTSYSFTVSGRIRNDTGYTLGNYNFTTTGVSINTQEAFKWLAMGQGAE